RPASSTLFPYTTLFRSMDERDAWLRPGKGLHCVERRAALPGLAEGGRREDEHEGLVLGECLIHGQLVERRIRAGVGRDLLEPPSDRKSTRLNSSHDQIS